MAGELPERKEIDRELTWDLSAIFKDENAFGEAIKKVEFIAERIIRDYKNNLKTPAEINGCLDELRELYMVGGWVLTYASLAASVDQKDQIAQERDLKAESLAAKVFSSLSFIDSQLSELPDEILIAAARENQENSGYLEAIVRKKPHVLHPETERVLSALTGTLEAPYRIYNSSKLADMDFGSFESKGETHPLSFLTFEGKWEYERDAETRRKAFDVFSKKLAEYQHTFASAYQTQVGKEKTLSELRGFDSVFDYLLHEQRVTMPLYNRQIDLIVEHLAPYMRRYARLIKKIHGLEKMTFADLKVEVDPEYQPDTTIDEAKNQIKDALSILGTEYSSIIDRAFGERWIDFPANVGKSTGAFCSTPYGSHAFVLLTWSGKMADVFTLIHELGHAGHFHLTHKEQSIFNSEPSLYLIEAPSTMNELLLAKHLLDTTDDKRRKRWILSSIVSKTYYHNFVTHLLEAHYQREVYRIIDGGGSVSAPLLNKLKRDTLEKFWGDEVEINEGAELTWMRQPHYYMGLYPYTYSAGLTIATEVSGRIRKDGQPAVEDWLEFLKMGGTKDPAGLAAVAGVDIRTDGPLMHTIDYIGSLIDEIEKLTDEL
ncbi:MAG: oligoendopeptidase F [Gudongella sp.]|nr:oligoendopeptidase F [Gudongella sp.]